MSVTVLLALILVNFVLWLGETLVVALLVGAAYVLFCKTFGRNELRR